MKDDYTTNSNYLTYIFLIKGWENVHFELGRLFIYSATVRRRLEVLSKVTDRLFNARKWLLCLSRATSGHTANDR